MLGVSGCGRKPAPQQRIRYKGVCVQRPQTPSATKMDENETGRGAAAKAPAVALCFVFFHVASVRYFCYGDNWITDAMITRSSSLVAERVLKFNIVKAMRQVIYKKLRIHAMMLCGDGDMCE